MKLRKQSIVNVFIAACLLLAPFFVSAQINPDFTKPEKPFCIAGNLYYVGTYDLACYLITTPKGHILINEGIESTVPQLRKNIEELGFKFTDIKILLNSQAHFDHVGGLAKIKKLTGAKVMVDNGDVAVVEDGGNSDYLFGGKGRGCLFTPVKVDRRLSDEDVIELGGMRLKMLHHPGHTKGACSFVFDVKDKERTYKVLIANMPTILDGTKPGMATYPNVEQDYWYTLQSLKKQQFDIWLCAHASQFYLHERYKTGHIYRPDLFMDKENYYNEIEDRWQDYLEKLGS